MITIWRGNSHESTKEIQLDQVSKLEHTSTLVLVTYLTAGERRQNACSSGIGSG